MVNYPFNGNVGVSKVNFLRYYLGFSLGFQKSLDNDLMRDFEFVASEKNESSCQKKVLKDKNIGWRRSLLKFPIQGGRTNV